MTSPDVPVASPRAALVTGALVAAVALAGVAWAARESIRRVVAPRELDACPAILPPPASCLPHAHVVAAAGTALAVVAVLGLLVLAARLRRAPALVLGLLGALVVVGVLGVAYVSVWPFPTPMGWLPR
ncbi:hypothetical protein [Cellulomonas biazotea]|uniref:Uncharacterized protein n=1 Tax=Cellulomonas biazotea TaxID=1709 RepID=A0A402DNT5_9CELL|nr:hypothetical protein [Cellulomonas biazotea]GCE75784.1 hypothetical protein CBZ_08400 [Cellulomonas biazotea]